RRSDRPRSSHQPHSERLRVRAGAYVQRREPQQLRLVGAQHRTQAAESAALSVPLISSRLGGYMKIPIVVVALTVLATAGCAVSSESSNEEGVSTASESVLAAQDLKDYGFTGLYFSGDQLKATLVNPLVAPAQFEIEGVSDKGLKAVSSLSLSAIDSVSG